MKKQQQATMEQQMQAQQAAQEAKQAEFQAEAQLKQMDNEAKLQVAQIGAESRKEVAKIQADVDRDLHDTKERNDMDKKAADYYIDRKNKEEEALHASKQQHRNLLVGRNSSRCPRCHLPMSMEV